MRRKYGSHDYTVQPIKLMLGFTVLDQEQQLFVENSTACLLNRDQCFYHASEQRYIQTFCITRYYVISFFNSPRKYAFFFSFPINRIVFSASLNLHFD